MQVYRPLMSSSAAFLNRLIKRGGVPVAMLMLASGGRAEDSDAGCARLLVWNEVFIDAIQAESTPPGLAARNLAIFHLAIHRAVMKAPEGAAPVAASAAANRVAGTLYPSRKASFDRLLDEDRDAGGGSEPSRVLGCAVADDLLAERRDDGASRTVHYVPQSAPGMWRRTTHNRPPELPQWPEVKGFVIESGAAFRPDGPPAMDSERFARAVDEVRRLGGMTSSERSEEQTLIARFWADFTHTSTPPGHWNEIARDVAGRNELTLLRAARLFALLNVALADAGIAAFDCKYHHNHWRPVTAIAHAAKSGDCGPAWQALLSTPSHPEYVSAHSTFSGAAAEILNGFFGNDADVAFTVTSIDVPGVTRSFTSFAACANEVGMSRIYGGIHFRYSNEDGLALGRKVARAVASGFDSRVATADLRSD